MQQHFSLQESISISCAKMTFEAYSVTDALRLSDATVKLTVLERQHLHSTAVPFFSQEGSSSISLNVSLSTTLGTSFLMLRFTCDDNEHDAKLSQMLQRIDQCPLLPTMCTTSNQIEAAKKCTTQEYHKPFQLAEEMMR
jgi:hypothetical protein